MNSTEMITAQYLAVLQMMDHIIRDCPDELWLAQDDKTPYWRLAYHALYFTHLYLHPSGQAFKAWSGHRQEYQFLGPLPWPPHNLPKIGEPYTRAEVLEFLQVCRSTVLERVPALDLDGPSGFDWLPMNKMELQIYNIRHIQHHVGELSYRLDHCAGVELDWVGRVKPDTE